MFNAAIAVYFAITSVATTTRTVVTTWSITARPFWITWTILTFIYVWESEPNITIISLTNFRSDIFLFWLVWKPCFSKQKELILTAGLKIWISLISLEAAAVISTKIRVRINATTVLVTCKIIGFLSFTASFIPNHKIQEYWDIFNGSIFKCLVIEVGGMKCEPVLLRKKSITTRVKQPQSLRYSCFAFFLAVCPTSMSVWEAFTRGIDN